MRACGGEADAGAAGVLRAADGIHHGQTLTTPEFGYITTTLNDGWAFRCAQMLVTVRPKMAPMCSRSAR